jgi:hypothetical protein
MCTMIVEQAEISGSGKGTQGWFQLRQVNVSYDHPYHLQLENALNIDFVNRQEGLDSRVAVELTPDSAVKLITAIQAALTRGTSQTTTD